MGLLLFCTAFALQPAWAQGRVVVRCGVPSDPPLVRKFGVANNCTIPMTRYRRDASALAVLKPQSLRVELGWGYPKAGWSKPLISGSAGVVQPAWEEIDALVQLCGVHGTPIAFSYCYTPKIFQRDDWFSPPASVRQWAAAAREYAYHFREGTDAIFAHEVWNRPDSSVFFSATRGTYFRLYNETAIALRDADPDAVVGGPAICMQPEWVSKFLNFVEFDKLPLDYFSLLVVSPNDGGQTWGDAPKRISDVRKALADSRARATTEIRLHAFNPLPVTQLRATGEVARASLAVTLLEQFANFLEQTDLTTVNWAQYMDSGLTNDAQGLLDVNGNPRPAFDAFALYSDLPVDRVAAEVPQNLKALAAASPARAGVLVWNPGKDAAPATIELQRLPFTNGMVSVHQIDAAHRVAFLKTGGWSLQTADSKAFSADTAEWRGEIPPGGIVYLRAEPLNPPSPLPAFGAARITRLHRYFANRFGSAYADFDRSDWTARLGMGKEDNGLAMIGVNLANCPTNFLVNLTDSRTVRKLPSGATLAVRVDIYDRSSYASSVLFHDGSYDAARAEAPPWGTRRAPDKVVRLPEGGAWNLDLAGSVPAYWGRRVIVTFLLRDAGPGTRARFALAPRLK